MSGSSITPTTTTSGLKGCDQGYSRSGYGVKNVLARYLLDNFIRKDFDRGNTDFFWLEMQYNRRGVPFVRPQFEYSKVKHIRLEKPGGDDWYLEELEVWINDLLLYQGRPNFWLNRANQQRDISL